jgi:hypothetical protein
MFSMQIGLNCLQNGILVVTRLGQKTAMGFD